MLQCTSNGCRILWRCDRVIHIHHMSLSNTKAFAWSKTNSHKDFFFFNGKWLKFRVAHEINTYIHGQGMFLVQECNDLGTMGIKVAPALRFDVVVRLLRALKMRAGELKPVCTCTTQSVPCWQKKLPQISLLAQWMAYVFRSEETCNNTKYDFRTGMQHKIGAELQRTTVHWRRKCRVHTRNSTILRTQLWHL